ncbi:N,N-dimethylformamidase beta subunit family domain-containing protein [Geodermatophilus sp. URMC 61]|uniref:N,N-dimethylformamidase beta subunit family domain-containing protein n=1 Tax=Geodermatophilus sp. URMC 61 TaxID=3423411 RepID=UPI00406CEC9B
MAERELRFSQWASVSPAAGWEIDAGPFTGGARSDLLGYHPGNGTLWVAENRGDRFAFSRPWATVHPADGWQFVVADVTGNGRADVVGYHPGTGAVWVGENRGDSFALARWATLAPATGWRIHCGLFTGRARADLLAYHRDSGSLWVGQNTGSAFAFTGTWATVAPGQDWQFATGDVIGNGTTDVVGYRPDDGSVWVGENRGSSFAMAEWARLSPAHGWHILTGLFTGRDRVDLLGYHSGNGTLWIGENQADRFDLTGPSATALPAEDWQFVTSSVNGDIWDDVVGYHPANGSVWVGVSPTRPIEGYCWPLSARPGQSVRFYLSHQGEAVASIQRHTSTSETVHSATVASVTFRAEHQVASTIAWRSGCGWDETFTLTVSPEWASGLYSATCTDSAGGRCDIPFVVKPGDDRRSRLAVLANVNTWLAYNGWGGRSKYSGLARTSFLRPMPNAAPGGDTHLTRGELWILGWLESQGHPPDVFTDIDFHNDGCDPAQYPLLIVGTHPEYWTPRMYDRLASYLDAGGSLAYLGGNGVFETGEYDNDQTEMVFRLGHEGGARELALFRTLGRPERSLLGVATERCEVPGSPYVVRAADHPLFAGTGLSNGDTIGDVGLSRGHSGGKGNGKASGWEVDTSRGPGATAVPTDCLLDPLAVPPSALPEGLVVLAEGAPDGTDPGADMTYYDHRGGGFVFSVGSLTFGGSLVVDPVLGTLVHNVLDRAGIR